MSSVVLNKETLHRLAGNNQFKKYGFLGPIRGYASLKPRKPCRNCSNRISMVYISDTIQELVLTSLQGSYIVEAHNLKRDLSTDQLILPLQSGLVII